MMNSYLVLIFAFFAFISKVSCEPNYIPPAVGTSFKLKSKQTLTGGSACVHLRATASSGVNFLDGRSCESLCSQRFLFNTNPTGTEWTIVKWTSPTVGLQVDTASLTIKRVNPLPTIANEHIFDFLPVTNSNPREYVISAKKGTAGLPD